MLVTFNPMINSSATTEAAYVNFLRCVTSIMTASVGAVAGAANSTPTTTNLSVVPYLNNTGSTDVSKNCIISVDASTEAGGWTTSSAHNVPTSATFNAYSTTQWRADFYNASGKATYPYNKISFHGGLYTASLTSPGGPTAYTWGSASSPYNEVISGHATVPGIAMTIGCSTNSAWTAADSYTPVGTTTALNSGTQTTSYTLAGWIGSTANSASNPYNQWGFIASQTGVVYKMAVGANYCIVWAQSSSNSYASGYNNSWIPIGNTGNTTKSIYGHILYGGLRETQAWENSYSNNNPWCAMSYVSQAGTVAATGVYSNPLLPHSFVAFMQTLNNSGVASGTATRYGNWNYYTATNDRVFLNTVYTADVSPNQQLNSRPFNATQDGVNNNAGATNFMRLPTTDPATGTLVPSAVPIIPSRSISGSWNSTGALRGIYKSLSVPLATFKLYWGAANQTFTIGSDQYIPVVINEEMWLVRYA